MSNDIKTRIYIIDNSLMGEIEQYHSYVSAEIVLLDNKTEKQNQNILNAVQNVLISYFKESDGKLSVTSRLTHVNSNFYKRYVNY